MAPKEKGLNLGPRLTDCKVAVVKEIQILKVDLDSALASKDKLLARGVMLQIREKVGVANALGMKDPEHPLIPFGCGFFKSPYAYIISIEKVLSEAEEKLDL